MRFLTGASLREAIARVTSSNTVSCAVAFWGRGAESLIGNPDGRKVRLICNLKMGGTNPEVIETLMKAGADIRQSDRLHAKVYIGDSQAVIASANASINGLGLEGDELSGWIETGVELPAEDALLWFDELWKHSRPILPQDIQAARRLFRERAIVKPSRGRFADFHPTRDTFPLICGPGDDDYDYNDSEIERSLGYVDDAVHEQIDNGLDIEFPEEVKLFQRGLWVLVWSPKADGMPDKRSKPSWTCSSGIHVPNAFNYKGCKPQGVVLAMDPMPPEPFDVSEQRFRDAFNEVMARDRFAPLRDQDYEEQGSFYSTARLECMWQFWVDLKRRYIEMAA